MQLTPLFNKKIPINKNKFKITIFTGINMKSYFTALFTLLISLSANSYFPLFLAQESLNKLPEKLIIQINSVNRKSVNNSSDPRFFFYDITLNAQVKFVGETNSGLRKGDIINILYTTTKETPEVAGTLDGHMPIKVPTDNNSLYIAYLDSPTKENYIVNTYWGLQEITLQDIPYTAYVPSSLKDTIEWINKGITELHLVDYLKNMQANN
jgi:hypothetical protein